MPRQLLGTAYAETCGSRKKKSISKMALSDLGWDITHTDAFNDFQAQL